MTRTAPHYNRRHGHTTAYHATKTYKAWQRMRRDCTNPRSKSYENYGGRGITVCAQWDQFENFLRDMGVAPVGKSLDRRDNNAGYSKDNCRWATPLEQSQNQTTTRVITHRGVTQCVSAWARHAGLPPTALHKRLHRGWDFERAISTALN